MAQHIISVDLGGTRIRAALLDKQLNILNRVETLTLADEGLEPTLGRIKEQIAAVLPDDGDVDAIGISAPGPLNPRTGVVVHPPNLPGWQDVPLAEILQDEFKIPVYLGNDANVAILAEATRGAAKGYRDAIYITISTGIGSGILVDGKMLLGRDGLAAEAGHMVMIVGDRFSSLEEEAAGPDMAAHARRRIEAGEKSAMVDIVDGDLDKLSGKVVGDAAMQGDALALDIIHWGGTVAGCGIVNLLHLFNPDVIVIGGGVTAVGNLIFDPINEAIKKYSIDDAYWEELIVAPAALRDDVSIYGAGALVLTEGGTLDIAEVSKLIGADS